MGYEPPARKSFAVPELLLDEQVTESDEPVKTYVRVSDGAMHLRTGVAAFEPLPLEALSVVMRRYGKPLDPEVLLVGPFLELGENRTLHRLRHRARYDVVARDFLVYRTPDGEPLAELAISVTAALLHLARAATKLAGT